MVGLADACRKRFEFRQQLTRGAASIQSKQQTKAGAPSNFDANSDLSLNKLEHTNFLKTTFLLKFQRCEIAELILAKRSAENPLITFMSSSRISNSSISRSPDEDTPLR